MAEKENPSKTPRKITVYPKLKMGQVFHASWLTFKDHWSRLLAIQGIAGGVVLGLYFVFTAVLRYINKYPELLQGGYRDELPLVVGAAGVVTIALLITYVWIIAASALFVYRAGSGEEPKVGTVLRDSWRGIGHIFLYYLLIALVLGFVIAVIAIPLAPYLYSLRNAEDARILLLVLIVLLGFAGFRIVSWWLWVKLGFGPFAVFAEKKDAFKALSRSWKLSVKNFWRVFGVLVAIQVGVYIFTRILAFVVNLGTRLEIPDLLSADIFNLDAASTQGLVFMGILAAGFQVIRGLTLWPAWGSLYKQLGKLSNKKSDR